MILPEDVNYKNAKEQLGVLIEAVPKSKRALFLYQMCAVEMTLDKACRLLTGIREYLIDGGQTKGGFVDEIDKLLPRGEKKTDERVPPPPEKKAKKR